MQRRLVLATLATFACQAFTPADAADRGSTEEAKAMAIKAARYLHDVGPDVAFPAFNAKDGPWHDKDLYVYVSSKSHTVVAHGTSPTLIGRNAAGLKDVDGKSISEMINGVENQGWIEYKWQDPLTRQVTLKTSYVVNEGDYHVVVGAFK
jgi:hypothetical protein